MNAPLVDAEQAHRIFEGTLKAGIMANLLRLAARDTFDGPSEADEFREAVELAAGLIGHWLDAPREHASDLCRVAGQARP